MLIKKIIWNTAVIHSQKTYQMVGDVKTTEF